MASPICAASSRVGTRIKALTERPPRRGFNSCKMGRTNAAVLPEPVRADAQTSFPRRMAGIAAAWMGVGVEYPCEATARRRGTERPREEKGTGKKNVSLQSSIHGCERAHVAIFSAREQVYHQLRHPATPGSPSSRSLPVRRTANQAERKAKFSNPQALALADFDNRQRKLKILRPPDSHASTSPARSVTSAP